MAPSVMRITEDADYICLKIQDQSTGKTYSYLVDDICQLEELFKEHSKLVKKANLKLYMDCDGTLEKVQLDGTWSNVSA